MNCIVHLTTTIAIGGAEAVLASLVTHDTTMRHVVLYIHDGAYKEQLVAQGIAVHAVAGFFWRYDPTILVRIVYYLVRYKPRLLHSWLWSSNLLAVTIAWLLRIPCTVSVHSPSNRTLQATNSPLRLLLDAWIYYRANAIIAVSAAIAADLTKRYPAYSAKIKVIYNGVDTHYFMPAVRTTMAVAEQRPLVIGMIGRFVPLKNHRMALRCCAQLQSVIPHMQLLLVGFGPLEESLRLYSQELGIAAIVTIVHTTDIMALLPRIDLYVSTSYVEGISIALLQAMAAGKAVIVTSTNGLHEVVTHRYNGIIVHPDDDAAFSAAIQELSTHTAVAEQYGLQARRTVQQHFSYDTMIAAYQQHYRSCLLS